MSSLNGRGGRGVGVKEDGGGAGAGAWGRVEVEDEGVGFGGARDGASGKVSGRVCSVAFAGFDSGTVSFMIGAEPLPPSALSCASGSQSSSSVRNNDGLSAFCSFCCSISILNAKSGSHR